MKTAAVFQSILVVGMAVLLILLCYDTLRVENLRVQALFAGLFVGYAGYLYLSRKKAPKIWMIFLSGLALRLVLGGAIPTLSDDYFRYTWDGHIANQGFDPYTYTPEQYVAAFPEDSLANDIMQADNDGLRLNSRRFYSVYPTTYQVIFAAADWLTGSPNRGNIWFIRAVLILFECLTFWILLRLLRHKKIPEWCSAIYWLNPLVIVEFTGNLHFDGIAVFFMLLATFYVFEQRLYASSLALGVAIATKLNPVFLACIAWREWKLKRWVLWSVCAAMVSAAILVVYFNGHNLYHVKWSYRLYLYAFHFNSSALNAIRGLAGRDAMETAMGIFPTVTPMAILALNFLKKKWGYAERIILAFSIYFFLGTTMHPWYVLVLLPYALLVNWKFPIVWSYLIVWTYAFYHLDKVEQIGWVVGLEYGLLALFVFMDLRGHWKKTASGIQIGLEKARPV